MDHLVNMVQLDQKVKRERENRDKVGAVALKGTNVAKG